MNWSAVSICGFALVVACGGEAASGSGGPQDGGSGGSGGKIKWGSSTGGKIVYGSGSKSGDGGSGASGGTDNSGGADNSGGSDNSGGDGSGGMGGEGAGTGGGETGGTGGVNEPHPCDDEPQILLPFLVSDYYTPNEPWGSTNALEQGIACPERDPDAEGSCYGYAFDPAKAIQFPYAGINFHANGLRCIERGANRLVIYARGASGGEKIKVQHPTGFDYITLTDEWEEYTFILSPGYNDPSTTKPGVEVAFILGAESIHNSSKATFYIDDVRWVVQ